MIQYRTAEQKDIPAIAHLARVIWDEHYPEMITQGQIDYMLDLMYSEEALKAQMGKGHHFIMLEEAGIPVGYLSFARDEKNPEYYFLHKFYLLKSHRNNDAGSKAFKEAEQIMRTEKATGVRLFVNRENYRSINFYFKNGFRIQEVINQDIGGGYYMNDFIMVKHFNHAD